MGPGGGARKQEPSLLLSAGTAALAGAVDALPTRPRPALTGRLDGDGRVSPTDQPARLGPQALKKLEWGPPAAPPPPPTSTPGVACQSSGSAKQGPLAPPAPTPLRPGPQVGGLRAAEGQPWGGRRAARGRPDAGAESRALCTQPAPELEDPRPRP